MVGVMVAVAVALGRTTVRVPVTVTLGSTTVRVPVTVTLGRTIVLVPVTVGFLVAVEWGAPVGVEVMADVSAGAIAALAGGTDRWRLIATMAHAIIAETAVTTGRAETSMNLPLTAKSRV